jgi:hypothetical protein
VAPLRKRQEREPALISGTKSPTVHKNVDYSWLIAKTLESEDGLFDGILHYIYFHSGNCYNTKELSISVAGIQPGSDPVNILRAKDGSTLESGDGPDQCLVIEFHRIRVNPRAFAIRLPPFDRNVRGLKGLLFQGWNEQTREWVVLSEQRSDGIQYLLPVTRRGFVDTDLEFRKFRFIEAESNYLRGHYLALEAVEIHGAVYLNDDSGESGGREPRNTEEFNPWTIPDYA